MGKKKSQAPPPGGPRSHMRAHEGLLAARTQVVSSTSMMAHVEPGETLETITLHLGTPALVAVRTAGDPDAAEAEALAAVKEEKAALALMAASSEETTTLQLDGAWRGSPQPVRGEGKAAARPVRSEVNGSPQPQRTGPVQPGGVTERERLAVEPGGRLAVKTTPETESTDPSSVVKPAEETSGSTWGPEGMEMDDELTSSAGQYDDPSAFSATSRAPESEAKRVDDAAGSEPSVSKPTPTPTAIVTADEDSDDAWGPGREVSGGGRDKEEEKRPEETAEEEVDNGTALALDSDAEVSGLVGSQEDNATTNNSPPRATVSRLGFVVPAVATRVFDLGSRTVHTLASWFPVAFIRDGLSPLKVRSCLSVWLAW